MRAGPRAHLERAGRRRRVGREQREHAAAEAAADDPRAGGAGVAQPRDGRLDGGRRDLEVVAQARVRSVEQAPESRQVVVASTP